jgi:Asp-tRNA(Asn)/Glu-tRNA(Gln) amidotransferase A subunit family amidase
MVLAWSMDRVGPMCRTIEDCAMVFNAIHGVDEKDPSTVTTPFQFDRNIRLASLRVGVDANAPPELVDRLRALGVQPREIGTRPTVTGAVSGLNVEGAAAFDAYVQRKARETGLDLSALPEPTSGSRAGGPPGAPGGGAPANPMAPADWNPRFVNGRTARAFEFVQNQRRRQVLVQRWAAFMADLDLFIGGPQADTTLTAQTGHPCVVVPYKFDVPGVGAGRAGGPAVSSAQLNPQPIAAVIIGALFNDDRLLSFAHQLQKVTDFHLRRPRL